jgi:NADPH-dependent 2,4-dienoyl-CoA reductase/sulfur reductase-like enzyme
MRHVEVLVVGAGPAGLAAATAAALQDKRVLVLDDNSSPGGQIWRGGTNDAAKSGRPSAKTRAIADFHASGAELLPGRRVVDAPHPKVLQTLVEDAEGNRTQSFRFDKLILATGARERFLPFPGWTLPGVFGAGGLQALAKGGVSVAGKRVVVAGTGPLLMAVGAHLKQYGAKIVCVAEQAPLSQLLPFAASLWSHPAKLLQGAGYRAALAAAPYRIGCWPVAAQGDAWVKSVRLTDGKRAWDESCDMLACGFHLVPNTELPSLLGCEMKGEFVAVDLQQRTSVADVFCVGEPTGIAGVEAAQVQGTIAGLAAAGASTQDRSLQRQRAKNLSFGQRLDAAFQLRNELRSLAANDTIVCRCEDVTFSQLRGRRSWTDAKLQTRCGMGPCQGRICGPAVQTLFGWPAPSVRPPIFPVPVAAFRGDSAPSTMQPSEPTIDLQEIS